MPTRKNYLKRIHGPPEGEPWVWLTTELLASDPWRAMSINARRLIDFLLIEHRNHAGLENGNLKAPYDQLEKAGLTRECIAAAIDEAVFLGLIRVERGGRYAGTNRPSTYRLTFRAAKDNAPPTNDWKRISASRIKAWRDEGRQHAAAARKWRKNHIGGRKVALPGCGKPHHDGAKAAAEDRPASQNSADGEAMRVVREAAPLIYLGLEGARSAKPLASAARSAPDGDDGNSISAGDAALQIVNKLAGGAKG